MSDFLSDLSDQYAKDLAYFHDTQVNELLDRLGLKGLDKAQIRLKGYKLIHEVEGDTHIYSLCRVLDTQRFRVLKPTVSLLEIEKLPASENATQNSVNGGHNR